ncbi:MAG: DEAD/DEAH box helicase [Planctomycetes bacterium]|nr:DEAD/DEAH box helicase [Planctomycetota bacterium]
MGCLRIKSEKPGLFAVTVEGTSLDALSLRGIVGEFSNDPPQDPEAEAATYRVLAPKLPALLSRIAPVARRAGFLLEQDNAGAQVLAQALREASTLRSALDGSLRSVRFKLSSNFGRALTPKQREAVAWLLALPHGANFSVPGAGKTTITLAVHDVLRSRGDVSRLLVVGPRNAFAPWEEEVKACFRDPPRVVRLAGGGDRIRSLLRDTDQPGTIFLVGYQQAYFALDVLEEWLASHEGVHLVLDESHKIKSPRRGPWGSTVLALGLLTKRRDILTGTPAPHALSDLGTQVEFLWPTQSILTDAQLRDPNAEEAVSDVLRPLYVRIRKRDLGLRDPLIKPVPIQMSSLQRQIHDRIAANTSRSLAGLRSDRADTLSRLRPHVIRLLQVASNPALMLTEADDFDLPQLPVREGSELQELFAAYHQHEVPSKMAYAIQVAQARAEAGLKTIVWTSFVRNTEMLARLVPHLHPIVLHGGVPTALDMEDVPEESREARIDQFKTDPACFLMIANPAACSESVSLHRQCDHAIYLDRTFNAAALIQSMDRIHRLGLPHNALVTYELLISPGTIDEVVDRRLSEKVRRMGRLLDDETLRSIDLELEDDDDALAFDSQDAAAVIEFLQVERTRGA